MITKEHLEAYFTYHSPGHSPGHADIPKYTNIRKMAKELAQVICDNTPLSADQTVAIRKLRECVMYANAAIACTPYLPQSGEKANHG